MTHMHALQARLLFFSGQRLGHFERYLSNANVKHEAYTYILQDGLLRSSVQSLDELDRYFNDTHVKTALRV